MAIIRTLNKVENASLQDAILLTELTDNNKYNFTKLYINPNRECTIYFKGILPLKAIQAFSLFLEMILHYHKELKMKKSQPLKIMSIIIMIIQQLFILKIDGNIKQ